MLDKKLLKRLYQYDRRSMKEIADLFGCSVNKVQYWLNKHSLPRRSISEAIYQWHNPEGDPFKVRQPRSADEQILFGIGIGLYWGEGTKASKTSVRLGNTDPALLEIFLSFLETFFSIRREDFRFGLQIFNDINPQEALDFWTKELKIHRHQFYKVTVTRSVSLGTYRRKSRYGVLTIYYNNRKVRDHLVKLLEQQKQCRRSSGVERLHGKEKVAGSIPAGGSIF